MSKTLLVLYLIICNIGSAFLDIAVPLYKANYYSAEAPLILDSAQPRRHKQVAVVQSQSTHQSAHTEDTPKTSSTSNANSTIHCDQNFQGSCQHSNCCQFNPKVFAFIAPLYLAMNDPRLTHSHAPLLAHQLGIFRPPKALSS